MSDMSNAQAALIAASHLKANTWDHRGTLVNQTAVNHEQALFAASAFKRWLDEQDTADAKRAADAEELKALPLDQRVERLESVVKR